MSKYKKMKQLIADMRLPEYRYKQLHIFKTHNSL